MNIKRMADAYRARIKKTAIRAEKEVSLAVANPTLDRIVSAQRYLRLWYHNFSLVLDDTNNDLVNLLNAWSRLVHASTTLKKGQMDPDCSLIVNGCMRNASLYLGLFLSDNLPWIIEKSLTRSVKLSGIKLP